MIFARPETASLRDNLRISKGRVRPKIVCLVLSVALVSLGMMRAAEAVQNPPGCTANAVGFTLSKQAGKDTIVNGDTVTYTITISNGGSPACTASNLVVGAFCPDGAGNPTIPAANVNVQTAIPNPLLVPTAVFTYGTFTCTVKVNTGVTTATARDTLGGILNDLAGVDDPLSRANTVSVTVVAPDFAVNKVCTFINETTVNISGSVTNTGSEALTGLQCSDDAGGTVALSGTTIPVGGSVSYSGSFTTDTSPHTDTVTCTAVGQSSQVTVGPRTGTAACTLPTPPPIPTLSGWVMILLVVFLALVAVSTILRRKPIA
jgi:uncharacterized repeat protein (TIGR01451 family)